MIPEFTVTGQVEIQSRFRDVPPVAIRAAMEAVNDVDLDLARYIVFVQLGGKVLQHRTGQLADSIAPIPAVEAGGVVTGGVEQQDSRAPYGKWQEYGAAIPERFGHPVMAWTSPLGNPVFARHARGFTLPARSFMRTAEEEWQREYEFRVDEAIALAVNDAAREL